MNVRVLFFATCRTVFGCKESDVPLADGATVKDLKKALEKRVPQWTQIQSKVSIAVNAEYATDEKVLCDGDEVALIPPVSGGE